MNNLIKIKKILSRKEPIIYVSLSLHHGFVCLYKRVIDRGITYLLSKNGQLSKYCMEKIDLIANQADIQFFLNFLADDEYVKEVHSLECKTHGNSWLCNGVVLTAHGQKQKVEFSTVETGVTFTPLHPA